MASAHIDPATLHVNAAGEDGIPSLGHSTTSAGAPLNTSSSYASSTASTTSTKASTGKSSATSSVPSATGLRQRVNGLSAQLDSNPTVKNAKGSALKQIDSIRHSLGNYPLIVKLEKRTGVDRVALVGGGIFAYLLLIPFNLFGLALPTTTILTLVPPSFLALGLLEQPPTEKTEAATRALLAYFVTLGFIQFLESLAAGVLERRIPHYYTIKLIFLAYLLHPRTQGAIKLHQAVYRPLLAHAQSPVRAGTPAQSASTASSPTFPAKSVSSSSASGVTPAHSAPSGVDADGVPVPPGFEHKAPTVPSTLGDSSSSIPPATFDRNESFGLPSVPTPGLENDVLKNLSQRDPQAAEFLKTQDTQGEGFPIVRE